MTTPRDQPPVAPLIYFFADTDTIPAAWQGRFHLDNAVGPADDYPQPGILARGHANRACHSGPGGRQGLLAVPYTIPDHWVMSEVLQYSPDHIAEEVEIETGVWVIIAKTFDPYQFMRLPPILSNVELTRVRQLVMTSYNTKQTWFIPCCLPQSIHCGLPMKTRLQLGAWVDVPRPEYRDIAEIAETLYRAELGEIDPPSKDWIRNAVCTAVSVNYELTPAELGAIGVLDDNNYETITGLITDRYDRDEELSARGDPKKKNDEPPTPSATPSTGSGSPTATPTTSRPPLTPT